MSRHDIDYMKQWVNEGYYAAVYPFAPRVAGRNEAFVGVVDRVRKNKYGRISYLINKIEYMAEELFPSPDEPKLKIPRLRK